MAIFLLLLHLQRDASSPAGAWTSRVVHERIKELAQVQDEKEEERQEEGAMRSALGHQFV